MPGSSVLFGILRCFNARALDSDKPRSLVIDADMVIGFSKAGPVVAKVVLNHFLDGPPFDNGAFYYVVGRVASIDSSFQLGQNVPADRYEFVVDARTVRHYSARSRSSHRLIIHSDDLTSQEQGVPSATPSHFHLGRGTSSAVLCPTHSLKFRLQAGAKVNDRTFFFDIQNYVAGRVRPVGHVCTFPPDPIRWPRKPPFPTERKFINVIGSVVGRSEQPSGDTPLKRVVIDVDEMSFLGVDLPTNNDASTSGECVSF